MIGSGLYAGQRSQNLVRDPEMSMFFHRGENHSPSFSNDDNDASKKIAHVAKDQATACGLFGPRCRRVGVRFVPRREEMSGFGRRRAQILLGGVLEAV
jgi:hypothetical protein